MAIDDLGVYELRLYVHYLRVCWEKSGVCWQSTKTIAEATKMSVGKVSETRSALEKEGYIWIYRPTQEEESEGKTTVVKIIDRWEENIKRYSKPVSHSEAPLSHSETPLSPHETNKNKEQDIKTSVSENPETAEKARKASLTNRFGAAIEFQKKEQARVTEAATNTGSLEIVLWLQNETGKSVSDAQQKNLKASRTFLFEGNTVKGEPPNKLFDSCQLFRDYCAACLKQSKVASGGIPNPNSVAGMIANYDRNGQGTKGWLAWKKGLVDFAATTTPKELPEGEYIGEVNLPAPMSIEESRKLFNTKR